MFYYSDKFNRAVANTGTGKQKIIKFFPIYELPRAGATQ